MSELTNEERRVLRASWRDRIEANAEEHALGLAALEREIAERTAQAPSGRVRAVRRSDRNRLNRRGLWAGAGLGTVAVGILAGVGLTATPSALLGPVAPPDSHAAAVVLLERTADRLLASEVVPGTYLRIEERGEAAVGSLVESEDAGVDPQPVTYLTNSRTVSYVPEDPREAWIVRQDTAEPGEILFPTDTGGGDPALRERLAEQLRESTPEPAEIEMEAGRIPPGGFPSGSPQPNLPDLERLRAAPQEPAELRAFILETVTAAEPGDWGDLTEDEIIMGEILGALTEPTLPAAYRAGCLRLLATLPGIEAEAREPAAVSGLETGRDGDTAIVLAPQAPGDVTTRFIFDAEDARLTGAETVLRERTDRYPGIEPGTRISFSRYDVTVVDAIPPE